MILDDLKSVRGFFEKHKAMNLPLFLNFNDFQNLFSSTSKKTSDFIFKKLLKF